MTPALTRLTKLTPPAELFTVGPPVTSTFRMGRKTRMYIAGYTEPAMVTENWEMHKLFIPPIDKDLIASAAPPEGSIGIEVVAVGAGAGLPAGAYNFSIRWEDTVHDRRSPFSGLSPTITLDGSQAVIFHGVPERPSPDDLGVDGISFWVNRNGDIVDDPGGASDGRYVMRRIALRNSGVDTYKIVERIEGAPEVGDNLQRWPRITGCVVYHNRLYAWGNAAKPNELYASRQDRPEEFEGLTFRTIDGTQIIGAYVVRDTLFFFSSSSHHRLKGYDGTDVVLELFEPSIGGVDHRAVGLVNDIAYVPTPTGLFLNDGQSLQDVSGDARLFLTLVWGTGRAGAIGGSPNNWYDWRSFVDNVAGLYHVFTDNLYLVFDWRSATSLMEPLLSMDGPFAPLADRALSTILNGVPPQAMLTLTGRGSMAVRAYKGYVSSPSLAYKLHITAVNAYGAPNSTTAGLFGPWNMRCVIIPAPCGPDAGVIDDGATITDAWLWMSAQSAWEAYLHAGNEYVGMGTGALDLTRINADVAAHLAWQDAAPSNIEVSWLQAAIWPELKVIAGTTATVDNIMGDTASLSAPVEDDTGFGLLYRVHKFVGFGGSEDPPSNYYLVPPYADRAVWSPTATGYPASAAGHPTHLSNLQHAGPKFTIGIVAAAGFVYRGWGCKMIPGGWSVAQYTPPGDF